MADETRVREVSRMLRDLVEPIAANVYFAPEAQAAYGELDLSYLPGYFCSRSACMGRLTGEAVTATFGVFNPAIVIPSVDEGWGKADVDSVLAARERGAVASLTRILDGVPEGVDRATELLRRAAEAASIEGHPIHAGLRSLGWPGDPIGDLWRAADLVREHRGDSHVLMWVGYGVDAVEITMLTELWWRIPLGSYVQTRGWSKDEIEAARERLLSKGLIDADGFTERGEQLRDAIERRTDALETSIIEALGDDADELFKLLDPWATAVVQSGGYPTDPRTLTRR